MALLQLILDKNSTTNLGVYRLNVDATPIIHFTIEAPSGFSFIIYYNNDLNTTMIVPPSNFLELASEIININQIDFQMDASILQNEKVIFNYETSEEHDSSLNLNQKQIVQYIKGPRGKQGEPGYTPKRGIDYWTSEDQQIITNYIDKKIGNIELILDEIIELQNFYLSK